MKLTFKLSLVIVMIGLSCIALATALLYWNLRSSIQSHINTNQLATTHQTIDKIDRQLSERLIDIQVLSQEDQMREFLTERVTASSTATTNQQLKNFRAIAATWRTLAILDGQGLTRAATEPSIIGHNLPKDNAALAPVYSQARAGTAAYSDVIKLAGSNEPTLVMMAPIRNGTGAVIGTAWGEVAWPSVVEILGTIKDSTAHLLNHQGIEIGSSDSKAATKVLAQDYHDAAAFKQVGQTAGSGTLPSLANPKVRALTSSAVEQGVQNFKGNGWALVLETPTGLAFGPALQQTLSMLLALIVIVATGITIILLYIDRKIIRPVRVLNAAVARVTLGDLSQTVPVTSGDEVGGLGRNFNEMTYQLGATHRGLQESTRIAEEGQAQLESSINSLRQGFILTDHKGRVIMANAAAKEMMADRVKKHPGALKLEMVATALPSDFALNEKVEETIKKREAAKFVALPLGGRFLNLYLSPVVNEDEAIGCVLLLEDVTEERIMQRSRDEFFSIASHELRTPLTAIRGNTAMIQDYFPELLKDPSMKEMVTDIHESAVRLIEIVNDFLDASRLEQDKMQFTLEAFPVESIIEKVIYEMAGISQAKGIYLNFDQTTLGQIPMIYADKNRIKQVVYNLVGNAMKFTEKGGVTINCLIEGKSLKVCITDTGQGISEEGQQILFHKFQQSTSSILTRDNTRGTGLGLYISKLLLEHMGGSVKLEHTEVGKGTTFSFSVPVASETQVKTAQAATASVAASQASINGEPTPSIPDVPQLPKGSQALTPAEVGATPPSLTLAEPTKATASAVSPSGESTDAAPKPQINADAKPAASGSKPEPKPTASAESAETKSKSGRPSRKP